MIEHKSISIATQIFEKLERDILSGYYKRGEILTEMRLSESLGVSRTPIREALRRLDQEHIIEMTTKGACVLGITKDDIRDIYEIRMRVEGLAARWACERADGKALAEMKHILELQEFYTIKKDADNIRNMDSAFHLKLYEMSGSMALYDTLEPLHKKIIKYRAASVSHSDRAGHSYKEHWAIYKAIETHNGDLAESLVKEHLQQAMENIELGGDEDGLDDSTKNN